MDIFTFVTMFALIKCQASQKVLVYDRNFTGFSLEKNREMTGTFVQPSDSIRGIVENLRKVV